MRVFGSFFRPLLTSFQLFGVPHSAGDTCGFLKILGTPNQLVYNNKPEVTLMHHDLQCDRAFDFFDLGMFSADTLFELTWGIRVSAFFSDTGAAADFPSKEIRIRGQVESGHQLCFARCCGPWYCKVFF